MFQHAVYQHAKVLGPLTESVFGLHLRNAARTSAPKDHHLQAIQKDVLNCKGAQPLVPKATSILFVYIQKRHQQGPLALNGPHSLPPKKPLFGKLEALGLGIGLNRPTPPMCLYEGLLDFVIEILEVLLIEQ